MMRIAVIGPSRKPVAEPYAGGQERFTGLLARGLRKRGHHVELWARPGSDPMLADRLHAMVEAPALSTIASADPNLPEPDFLSDQVAYLAVIRDLLCRNDIDIVLNQSLHQLPLALSAALRVPLVTTLHTPPFPWMEVGAALAGPACHLVAVSAALRKQWETLSRIHVIHNGIDAGRFPVGRGGDDLAWVGRLTPDKGADIAVHAARKAGRRLRLAGPISDAEWYAAVIEPLLGPDVEYVGALGDSALAGLYGDSMATLVTPRWEEPFCLVAAESQMCGTPVVGLRRGGLPEVVARPGGVLVTPGVDEIEKLALAVETVEGADRCAVGAAARARLSSKHMLDGYEQLLYAARRSNGLEESMMQSMRRGAGSAHG
ncbi:glycosyltransferase [Mycobacterium sp. NPDC003323]